MLFSARPAVREDALLTVEALPVRGSARSRLSCPNRGEQRAPCMITWWHVI
ncbi:predicted protein [Plenodomus lingam JN3]|uniref:Predicted protein n=1 Tax=Leptosphaeria maculans (strain JN3 / isolate v23.1.3 / race Av1-4-5-6-7-8) TaxID=985895 RepID=E4ZN25_LEPMJ|nr:predicted protein [Plenodomus lingam JN3]CBX92628.1 predicted protein [Plenodomus lingam JN3]